MARKNPDKQPSKNAVALADLLADQQLDIDEIAEQYTADVTELQTDYLYSVDNRDEAMWINAEADITLTVDDFLEIPVPERDDNWVFQFNSMMAASYMQAVAYSGLLEDIVVIADKHSEALTKQNKKTSPDELKEIATEGVLNGKLKERKEIRGNRPNV